MVGQNIGKYRVSERIGRGGMGTVYRAIDETLHREVAIKVLNAELNDPEIAKRFRAEAITVARLSHPGIATIYELFQHEGQWLMVMEFVRGETLEHLVERMGALSPQRTAELCMQCLAALAHAHSMGVVHRDLKPANIMITETGAIKIMDFGIARVSGTEHLTSAGFMMGTPAYMAPEQVMGHEIDARADLYAMGVVFYRLTTAKLPFKGDTPFAMAQSQVNDPPTPIGTIRADLPPWVEQVVVRSLAKSPVERFQSAVEFHEAFARCLAGLPMATLYSSSAPTELMMTPPRAMPTGSLRTSMTQPLTGGISQAMSTGAAVGSPNELSGEVRSATASGPMAVHDTPTVAGMPPALGTPKPSASSQSVAQDSVKASASDRKFPTALVAGAAVLILVAAGAWMLWPRNQSVPAPTVAETTAPDVAATPPPPVEPPPVATAPTRTVTPVPSPAAPPAPATPSAVPSTTATDGRATADATAARGGSAGARATGPAGRGAVDEAHIAFPDVRMLVVNGRRTNDEQVTLSFVGGQISLLGRRTGSAVATMPYRGALHATYVHARDPRWDTGFASPPENLDVGGMLRTAKHWLVLQGLDAYIILRLEDSNWRQVLQTVEERTGIVVERPRSDDR